MYGIEEKIYKNLISYFNNNKYIQKVVLFGSRLKGNYKYNSDIDLCILCDKKYKGTIAEELDEIVWIYSVDLVFLDSMNDEIKTQIEKYGIEIYNNIIKKYDMNTYIMVDWHLKNLKDLHDLMHAVGRQQKNQFTLKGRAISLFFCFRINLYDFSGEIII